MRRRRMHTSTAMTTITGMNTARTIPRTSRTPTGIAMTRWSMAIRTCPTPIIGIGISFRAERDRQFSALAAHHQHAEEEDHEEDQRFGRAQRGLPADVVDDEEGHPEDRGGEHRGPKRNPERPECLHSASTGSWLAGGRASRSGG